MTIGKNQNLEADAPAASSFITLKTLLSDFDSGEMLSSGTVALKCGEVRLKETDAQSHSREATSACIMLVISRCQSLRVVITKGVERSIFQFSVDFGKRRRVRPHQRWLLTSRLKLGG